MQERMSRKDARRSKSKIRGSKFGEPGLYGLANES
jgi:hypothetical protein